MHDPYAGRSISRRSCSCRLLALGVRPRRSAATRRPLANRLLRCGLRADPRGLRDAAPHARAPLPALGAPAPERRPRRVGAGALRARAAARGWRPRPAGPRPSGSSRIRSSRSRSGSARTSPGTSPPPTTRHSGIRRADPRRARLLLRRRLPLLVAGASGRAARLAGGNRAIYLFAAFVLASPLGLLLALIPSAVYHFYTTRRASGASPR